MKNDHEVISHAFELFSNDADIRDKLIREDARLFAFFICYIYAKNSNNNDNLLPIHNNSESNIRFWSNLQLPDYTGTLASEYSQQLNLINDELWINTIQNLKKLTQSFPKWFDRHVDKLFPGLQQPMPEELRSLITSVAGITVDSTVLDPSCGTGGLLAAASERTTATVVGYENNKVLQEWSALRLSFMTNRNSELKSDFFNRAITEPKADYDFIISNPPFGSRISTSGIKTFGDVHSEFPENAYLESALIRTSLDRLKAGGKATFVVPNGFLSRGGYDRDLRAYLIDADYLQAVISLPPKLFAPSTNIETTILVIWKGKDNLWTNKVAFFDARNEFITDGRTNSLKNSCISEICASLTSPHQSSTKHHTVDSSEVKQQNYLLEPQRYLACTLARISSAALHERRNLIEDHEDALVRAKATYDRLRSQLLLDLDKPSK